MLTKKKDINPNKDLIKNLNEAGTGNPVKYLKGEGSVTTQMVLKMKIFYQFCHSLNLKC